MDCAQNSQLESLSKLTGELAHEIKNPLSTLKINVHLVQEQLQKNTSDPNIQRALRKLDIIQKEANRLQNILDAFLQYIGKPELQLGYTDLNEVLSDLIDFYSPQAQIHGITLRFTLYGQPLTVQADADKVKQVLLNMFINAQQAMPDGGDLMVQTDKVSGCARIRISDTGLGIAPDKQSRIFEPTFSTRSHGSGLGLATARKIIESHNGTVSVESEPGKGTAFTISLPLRADTQESSH